MSLRVLFLCQKYPFLCSKSSFVVLKVPSWCAPAPAGSFMCIFAISEIAFLLSPSLCRESCHEVGCDVITVLSYSSSLKLSSSESLSHLSTMSHSLPSAPSGFASSHQLPVTVLHLCVFDYKPSFFSCCSFSFLMSLAVTVVYSRLFLLILERRYLRKTND
jgi:hypothetical protein